MGTFGTAEIIDVTSSTATKPAMGWTLVDDQSHFHAYDLKGELPTLIGRARHIDCDGSCGGVCGGEGYDIVEYFCVLCDQQIEPERISDTGQKSIPGRMKWQARVQSEKEVSGKVTVRVVIGDMTMFGVAEARTDAWSSGPDPVAFTTRLYGISPLGKRRG
jgi:hypothetical protein